MMMGSCVSIRLRIININNDTDSHMEWIIIMYTSPFVLLDYISPLQASLPQTQVFATDGGGLDIQNSVLLKKILIVNFFTI